MTIYHVVGGSYQTGLFFWSSETLLCARHTRGLILQPATSFDIEQGFGVNGCPFCPGGALENTFHQYRSQKRLMEVLDTL